MNEQHEMNNGFSALEASLSRLAPTALADPCAMMFKAGQAAGKRTRRRWQILSAAAILLAVGAAIISAMRPAQVVDHIVYIKQRESLPVSPKPPARVVVIPGPTYSPWPRGKVSEHSYIRLRREVLKHGLSALPVSSRRATAPLPARQLIDELLQ